MNAATGPSESTSRWRPPRPGRLIQNAAALMISTGGTGVLGVVFWYLAAHLAKASSIGRTSAAIAAMVLVANLAQLSFGSIFERFLPVAGARTRAFVLRAYFMCIITAAVLATAYVLAGFSNRFLPHTFAWRAYFVLAAVMWTLFVLQDSALIGLRASRWVPVENILFALAKLALLPVFVAASVQGLFIAWTVPVLGTIICVTWYLFSRRIPAHMRQGTSTEELPSPRELTLLAGAQYATLLFSVFTPSIISLIVIEHLGAVANAHYYIPSLIVSSLALFNLSIVRSFLVEASHEPHAVRKHAKSALRGLAAVVIPSVALGELLAPQILDIFGQGYARAGATLLRLMLLSLVGGSVGMYYSGFAWLDRQVWWMTIRNVASVTITYVVLLTQIDHYGINAIGMASVASSVAMSVLFLPITVRRYRRIVDWDPES